MQLILGFLAIFVVIGFFIPVYAQNVSNDEEDIKMREEIEKCKTEINENDSLTEAEKTVAKRHCETEITNQYKDVQNDHKDLAEKKARLNNIQKCVDWYPQFKYLSEQQFRVQKNIQTANNCILLYNDTIWEYDGSDRLEKLLERLDEIKSKNPDVETSTVAEIPVQPQTNIVKVGENQDKINELETKIKTLEEELIKKDQIIREQMKVIMDLANRIKNIVFEPFTNFLANF